MAADETTLGPIVPYPNHPSGQSMQPVPWRAASTSTTYTQGDIVVYSSGKVAIDNVDPTAADVVGVVANTVTTGAAVGDADLVMVWPALAGALFEGSFVNTSGDADITGFTFGTDDNDGYSLDNTNIAAGFPCVDQGNKANENVTVLGPAVGQRRGLAFDSDGTTGTKNPRVIFVFKNSHYITLG